MKETIKNLASGVVLLFGSALYLFRKKNLEVVYQALIRSFCYSGGRTNDLLSTIISFKGRKEIKGSNEHESKLADQIVSELNVKGYYVLDNYLSEDVLNNLINITEKNKCSSRKKLDENIICSYQEIVGEDKTGHINGTRLDYKEGELLLSQTVQEVILNKFFLTVAGKYLKADPIVDIAALWWTIAEKELDLIEDAQMFHFDMDRIKWLKIFVYLTDVEPNNGPHVFVEGSHRTSGIPKKFLRRGYQRIEDSEVVDHYGAEKLKTFCGKKGTIIFEDTRGLHKGTPIQSGARLVFQVEYTNSLFGAPLFNKKVSGLEIKNESVKEILAAYC